jgi:hypothetical protein
VAGASEPAIGAGHRVEFVRSLEAPVGRIRALHACLPPSSAGRSTRAQRGLEGPRRHQIELETLTRQQIGQPLPALGENPHSPALGARLHELVIALGHEQHTIVSPRARDSYEITNIQAPAFDARSKFSPDSLCSAGTERSGVQEVVQVLVRAADRVTASGRGHRPIEV